MNEKWTINCEYIAPSQNKINSILTNPNLSQERKNAMVSIEKRVVYQAMKICGLRAKVPTNLRKVYLTYTIYKKNKNAHFRDKDNFISKWYQDGFKKFFMVTDDDMDHLDFKVMPFKIDKCERIEIEVERIE